MGLTRGRRFWAIGMVLLTASCGGSGNSAPSVATAPSVAVWHGMVGCPVLSNPPYGLSGTGGPSPDGQVDTATEFQLSCDYKAPEAIPILTIQVRVVRTPDGIAQTRQEYATQRSAAVRLGGVDCADIAQVGDGAYAWYDQSTSTVLMRAHAGNATVAAELLVGRAVVDKWDPVAPLPPQLPVLTPVLKTFIEGLS